MEGYKIEKIKGIDCPTKYLLLKNDKPIIFANTASIAGACIAYLTAGVVNDILDDRILKFLARTIKQAQ